MASDPVKELHDTLFAAYADLWAHYQAILHVVSARLGVQAEHLETEAQAWIDANRERLAFEGHDRLAGMMGRRPPPPV